MNTFLMWLHDNRERIQQELKTAGSSTHPSIEAGQQWQALDSNAKQVYTSKFEEATKQFKAELARYSTAAKQKFCQNTFPATTTETTPEEDTLEETPTPVAEDEDIHLEADLENLLDNLEYEIDPATRQAVINFMKEHQGVTLLHGDIISWYQEETDWADISQDHIRNTVRCMIYHEGTIKILTEPTLQEFDENIITLSDKHQQHIPTIVIDDNDSALQPATQPAETTPTQYSAPASWPKPPDHYTLVPIQQAEVYPGSDNQDDDELIDAIVPEQETPVTPRDGISFNMAEGTTPEHVSSLEHCQHYPNWSAQSGPTRVMPIRDIPAFPEATEIKQVRRTSRKTHSPTGEQGADCSPPRSAEQGHPGGRPRAL